MEVNSYQVGGTHYKSRYEHWDWVIDIQMGYLEGCATKYATRWRHKDGLKDLHKALHYVNKLLTVLEGEETDCARGMRQWRRSARDWIAGRTALFAEANKLLETEVAFVAALSTWSSACDVREARDLLLMLMDVADPSRPTPVEDSNKHALMED